MPGNLALNYARIITSTEWGRNNLGAMSKRWGKGRVPGKALPPDCLERKMKPFYHVKIPLNIEIMVINYKHLNLF